MVLIIFATCPHSAKKINVFNYCGYALVGVGLLFIGQVNFFGIQVCGEAESITANAAAIILDHSLHQYPCNATRSTTTGWRGAKDEKLRGSLKENGRAASYRRAPLPRRWAKRAAATWMAMGR